MSNINFYDNFPSLFIDIGTESVKFTQPILTTTTLTKEIIKQNNNTKLSNNENDFDSFNIVNSNTIFDYKKNINKLSIIDAIRYFDDEEDCDINYDEKITYDLYYNTYLRTKNFSFEPIFSGLFQNFLSFETILNNIGNKIYKEKYFSNEKFKETPLIITQESLPLKLLGKQVSKIYEILFEKFEANYAIICSNAMLNLFSHNIINGIVVDLGESKTSITPIKNGYALYDNSIRTNFLSGRTIINYINQIKNHNDDNNVNSISLNDYLECRNLMWGDKKKEENLFNNNNYSHIPYLYTFPEVFKFTYRKDFNITHNQIRDFINSPNSDENKLKNDDSDSSKIEVKTFNDREYIDAMINNNLTKVKYLDFDSKINTIYSQADPKKNIEKEIFESSNNFVNKEELSKFRQFSLSHMICSQIEKFVDFDVNNIELYNNIVFTGGILNISNIKNILNDDLKSLIADNTDKIKVYFPDISDAALGMYKGCNYISRLDNLKDLLITRDLYNEVGYENLCYNYI